METLKYLSAIQGFFKVVFQMGSELKRGLQSRLSNENVKWNRHAEAPKPG